MLSRGSDIESCLRDNPIPGWSEVFNELSEEIHSVSVNLKGACPTNNYYPELDDIFNAFRNVSYEDVKIVILGQDPYPQFLDSIKKPVAVGMSFSVRHGDDIPKSLLNIFKELKYEYPRTFPKNPSGDLTPWARQGVLLLNGGSLTFNPAHPEAKDSLNHVRLGLWKPFIVKVLQKVASKKYPVFIAWGNDAKKICSEANVASIGSTILEGVHPVARGGGFIGTNHFRIANDLLAQKGIKGVDWDLLEPRATI